MNQAYLLIGGNLGEKWKNLEVARTKLNAKAGKIVSFSGIYKTAAWGKTDQPSFLNQALKVETWLSPKDLLKAINDIEREMGRERLEKFGPRLIDIDILFYNDEIVAIPELRIPHPELQNRRFVLVPLADIASDYIHPVLKKKVSDLLENCPDRLDVHPAEPGN